MKRVCLFVLLSLLAVLPALGSCVTWGEVKTGLTGSGSYSGGGVSATKSGSTISISGGEISDFRSDINASSYTLSGVSLSGHTSINNSWGASTVDLNNVNINGSNLVLYAEDSGSSSKLEVNYSGNAKLDNVIDLTADPNAVLRFNNNGSIAIDSGASDPFYVVQNTGSVVAINNGGSISVKAQDTASNPSVILYVSAPLSSPEAYSSMIDDLHFTGVDYANIYFNYWDEKEGVLYSAASFKDYPLNDKGAQKAYMDKLMGRNTNPDQENWEPSRKEIIAHEMEEKRQAASAGNVMGSPWPCTQLNLNYASRNLWVRGQNGEKVFHTSYVNWLGTGRDAGKNLTLKVQLDEMDGVNIRYDATVLEVFERCGITQITVINDYNEPYMVYSVAGMRAAHEQAGLKRREILVIAGPDDEIMTCGKQHDSEPVPVTFPEQEAAPAENP